MMQAASALQEAEYGRLFAGGLDQFDQGIGLITAAEEMSPEPPDSDRG